jgi:histidinol-phosphatase
MNPWDIAAIVPCVEEAGGVVSNLQGQREGIIYGGSLIAAANADLLTAALHQLQG